MATVLPVKFKYTAHDLWFDPGETGAQEGDHVICSTERGQEIGLATMDATDVSNEHLRDVIGEAGRLKPVVRIATDADLDRAEHLADKGEQAFPVFKRLAHESGLDMKPVGVEYLFGGGKVVCYFSAEERVDFRQLVRDLSRELHERIDMRQIGVREEAAIVGGFGHCGQELCCARFGHRFEPVSIRMAKEQDLPLNSTKISGACGRLMCCLRYEFEAYRDFKSRAPKRNAVIQTPLGKAKIVEYDTPKEQIALRLENGKQIRVPLAEMEASPAAHKKSEDLGCPCRPDTVSRSALERLNSPDVQMALAELDRKNGVTPKETFDESDIFVETKPRRRHGGGESGGQGSRKQRPRHAKPEAAQPQAASSGEQHASRRRRRKKTAETGSGQSQQTAREQRKSVQAEGGQPQGASQSAHRRRHHHAGEGSPKAQAEGAQQRNQQGQAKQGQRRRRHPGDHGGQGQASGSKEQQAPRAEGGGQGNQSGQGASEKPRRRRHHRGGRGHGNQGGQTGQGGNPGGNPTA